jgi:DNA-binding MarR family transcriptional regulator
VSVPQLTLDGREVQRPTRTVALTARQREVLRFVRTLGDVRPLEIGVLMHVGREQPCRVCGEYGHCRHASSDGFDALRRLEQRGLVYRERRGHWRAVVAVEDWRGL